MEGRSRSAPGARGEQDTAEGRSAPDRPKGATPPSGSPGGDDTVEGQ
jgi:hypothetical protein